MTDWMRLLRHRWFDERDSHRLIDPACRSRLEARVRASEAGHSGEIRLCVEAGLPRSYLWRGASARERALGLFGELRVWDTEYNNGVLIYLLLAEHRIEVIADRGLARHVEQGHWQRIVDGLADALRAGRHEAGLLATIDAVDEQLRRCFPLAEGDNNPNELPDPIDLR